MTEKGNRGRPRLPCAMGQAGHCAWLDRAGPVWSAACPG